MFEKARVHAILHTNKRVTKKQQFLNYNKSVHDEIVSYLTQEINSVFRDKKTQNNKRKYSELQIDTIREKLINRYFNKIPDNTLIAEIINTRSANKKHDFVLCYPFFSSHFLLPVKPGEVVWVYKYDNEKVESRNKVGSKEYELEYEIEKRYWMSRVHGESFTEDLNYTNYDRSFIPSILQDINNFDLNPVKYIDNSYSYDEKKQSSGERNRNDRFKNSSFKTTQEVIKDHFRIYSKVNAFYLGPTSKTQKNPGDMVIQGSNNNIIKLFGQENNQGNISLIAGKGKIQNISNEDYEEVTNVKGNLKVKVFKSSTTLPNIISVPGTNPEIYENFKSPEFYQENLLLDNLKYKENFNEGNLDLENDASLVYIAESSNENFYKKLFVYSEHFNVQRKYNSIDSSSSKSTYSIGNKEYEVDQFKTKSYRFNYKLPSISLKSNNINIISRRETDEFESGKISLIKDSRFYNSYSHIILDSDGQVNIDGSKIVIGNLNRFPFENGKGDAILLGASSEMEPLVKGNHLVATLEHLILNIQNAFNSIASAIKDISTHEHPGPWGPISAPVSITNNLQTVSGEINAGSEIQKEMNEISKNLDKLLSALVRTS